MAVSGSQAQRSYTPRQEQRILGLARASMLEALNGRQPGKPALEDGEDSLHEPRGCFVTLNHRHGQLRGCIGTFQGDQPLWMNVVRMAAAATRDPRFVQTNPVVLPEANDLIIEVSVLTPMQRIEDPLKMRPGVDGIHLEGRYDGRAVRGCFLPQVAEEAGWDAAETLSQCCAQKMGIPADAWRDAGDLAFYVFQAVKLRETPPRMAY